MNACWTHMPSDPKARGTPKSILRSAGLDKEGKDKESDR
jgi:hypothetical protein